jgi:hypothetical protein
MTDADSNDVRSITVTEALSMVSATLRTAAKWIPEEDRPLFYDVAEEVDRGLDAAAWCCPVCDEMECDTGCPLEHLRLISSPAHPMV